LAQIREPGVFIVDDVAFVQPEHGMAIGEAIARRGMTKSYYLETRSDVLLRNKDVFKFWRQLGLKYMFLGLEAIDDEGLKQFRKRVSFSKSIEALEYARSLGLSVAVNIIADPDWDRDRFETIRQFCLEIPEIVNISVNTPYPGTETWRTESRQLTTQDYRLFDIQHAVLPTRLPLAEFYQELVKTQQILNKKHLGWSALKGAAEIAAKLLLRGQTNFVKMLWKFDSVYNPHLLLADHQQPVPYKISLPPGLTAPADPRTFYIHSPVSRRGRAIDSETEAFVNATSMGSP
jgi:hopanoid C-3 methylase HpnR